jgi:membrane protease YdiL (CAAX protease family)
MTTITSAPLRQILSVRWQPNKDLVAVGVSYVLVVGCLYTATVIVGPAVWGGFAYFLLYALGAATLCGVGLPLYWTTVVRRRPVSDLGLTTRRLGLSLVLQAVLAALLYSVTLARVQWPPIDQVLPLMALALAIGFFEAVFWRGWVLLRLEESFGVIPAVVVGSALYAFYHIGYAMPLSEIAFLFFIGVLYAVTFRLTKNILVIWPLFQPMGQLVTLIRDGLPLPPLAALGFAEVLVVMLVLVGLAARYYRKHAGAARGG